MAPPRPLIAGNWKMNGVADSLKEAEAIAKALTDDPSAARVALCPPATLIERLAHILSGSSVEIGGQDCRAEASGAFTGDISAEMLRDAGAGMVILGHSERRTLYGETDAEVAAKVKAAMRAGLEPIVCVGETLEEREDGQALEIVEAQLAASLPDGLADHAFAVAYEPVWAIGTGRTPTLANIETMHLAIRKALRMRFSGEPAPILYGGSVKGANAAEILAAREVSGALVGGASLAAMDFLPIVRAL